MNYSPLSGWSLLWVPPGFQPNTAPVMRGNGLRFVSCIACNWPLINPCPVCQQIPPPEVVEVATQCPIMISDDGVNFHRHCLKGNICLGAMRTQEGVTICFVSSSIAYPIPFRTVALQSLPQGLVQPGLIQQGLLQQGLIQQGLIQQGLIQQGLIQQGLIQQGPVLQGPVPQGMVQQGIFQQVQPNLMLITQAPLGVMLQPVAQSTLVGAPLTQMGAAEQTPSPQADSSEGNGTVTPEGQYGRLCDCSDLEED